MIETNDVRNKKGDKQDFCSYVNHKITSKIQSVLEEKSEEYNSYLNEYLECYSETINNISNPTNVSIDFNASNSFALGMAGLVAAGASGMWLATSATPAIALTFGTALGFAPIFAVGGAIGIAISGVLAAVIGIFKAATWKKDLAKKIIKTYEKEGFLSSVLKEADKYWKDTKDSFNIASKKIEEDWQEKIKNYKEMADEKNIEKLKNMLQKARIGIDFFTKMPSPEEQ